MTAARGCLAALALVAACRASEPPTSTGSTSPGGGPMPPAVPAGQQCLPAMICDAWAGCALVGGGKVIAADRLSAGEPVRVQNGCTTGATCLAAMAVPAGVTCPVHTIPPKIDPPPYSCAWNGSACTRT